MKGARRDLWKYAVIYTTEQGGIMRNQPMWATREQYEEAKERGYLIDPSYDFEKRIPLAMIAFAEIIELWDFRLPAGEE